MEDKIQNFRQPLVTATGILLGFILNFASSYVKNDIHTSDFTAYIIGISILLGIISLILVLYRILNMNYPRDKFESYYEITLRFFVFGVSISFIGVLIDMFSNFMID